MASKKELESRINKLQYHLLDVIELVTGNRHLDSTRGYYTQGMGLIDKVKALANYHSLDFEHNRVPLIVHPPRPRLKAVKVKKPRSVKKQWVK